MSAEAEAKAVAVKLDGTIEATTKRILQLYSKLKSAEAKASEAGLEAFRRSFKPSLPDAIEFGRLLTNMKASKTSTQSKKGTWLKWLKTMPFDQKTAWRYMEAYRRRDALGSVPNVTITELLALPDATKPKRKRRDSKAVEELVSKGIARGGKDARRILRAKREESVEATAPVGEPTSEPARIPVHNEENPRQPETVEQDSDLTSDELSIVEQLRSYKAATPERRVKVFMRRICEGRK
jgi:hypothetical protein